MIFKGSKCSINGKKYELDVYNLMELCLILKTKKI